MKSVERESELLRRESELQNRLKIAEDSLIRERAIKEQNEGHFIEEQPKLKLDEGHKVSDVSESELKE